MQGGASWREEHDALRDLRNALQDPGQYWLTAAEDRPDYGFELRMLGRALALSVLGQVSALEAKAAVSRIRIDARTAAGALHSPGDRTIDGALQHRRTRCRRWTVALAVADRPGVAGVP